METPQLQNVPTQDLLDELALRASADYLGRAQGPAPENLADEVNMPDPAEQNRDRVMALRGEQIEECVVEPRLYLDYQMASESSPFLAKT